MNQNTDREEIKEFISGAQKSRRKRNLRKRRKNSEQQVVAVTGFVLMTVIFLVVGIFACRMGIVPVCILALLEVVLARCFYDLPVFVHLLIVAAQIVAGVIGGGALIALVAALLYFVAVIVRCYLYRT
mgnify:FL=1